MASLRGGWNFGPMIVSFLDELSCWPVRLLPNLTRCQSPVLVSTHTLELWAVSGTVFGSGFPVARSCDAVRPPPQSIDWLDSSVPRWLPSRVPQPWSSWRSRSAETCGCWGFPRQPLGEHRGLPDESACFTGASDSNPGGGTHVLATKTAADELSSVWHKSPISIMNSPFRFSFNGNERLMVLRKQAFCARSITAPRLFMVLIDNKNGVAFGTTSTISQRRVLLFTTGMRSCL